MKFIAPSGKVTVASILILNFTIFLEAVSKPFDDSILAVSAKSS